MESEEHQELKPGENECAGALQPQMVPELLEKALRAHQQGRINSAEENYRTILAIDPCNRFALQFLGLIEFNKRNVVAAIGYLEKAATLRDAPPLAHWLLARAFVVAARAEDAAFAWKQLYLSVPEDDDERLTWANRLEEGQQQRYAAALVDKIDPSHQRTAKFQRDLAALCKKLFAYFNDSGQHDQAIAILRIQSTSGVDGAENHKFFYKAFRQLGDYQKALDHFRVWLSLVDSAAQEVADSSPVQIPTQGSDPPTHENADVNVVQWAIRLKEFEIAKTALDALERSSPGDPTLKYLKAAALHEESKEMLCTTTGLLADLDRQYGEDATFCRRYGLVQADIGNMRASLTWLYRALGLSNTPPAALYNEIAKVHMACGENASAAEMLSKAIAIKPDLVSAYFDSHRALLADGRTAEAVALFERALSEDVFKNSRQVDVHPALMSGTADFIETQKQAIRRGVPAILLNSLGKSGSTFVMLRLVNGLRIPALSFLLGQNSVKDVPVPAAVRNMAKGGCISRQHFAATEQIVHELRNNGINKMILQLRDPRQLVLSNLHYIDKLFGSNDYTPPNALRGWPNDYFSLPLERKIDFLLDKFITRDTGMVQSWIDAQKNWPELDIHYCTYEDMLTDSDSFLREILNFYGIASADFDWSATVDKSTALFRKGKPDEWRSVFSEEQKRRARKLMPDNLSQRFRWHE